MTLKCKRHGTAFTPEKCAICRGYVPRTKHELTAQKTIPVHLLPLPCSNRGPSTGEYRQCEGCGNKNKKAELFKCKVHGVCTEMNPVKNVKMCRGCPDRAEQQRLIVNMGAGGIGDGLLGLLAVGSLRSLHPGKHITYRVSPLARGFVGLFDGGYDLLEVNDWDNYGRNTPRTGDLQCNEGYVDEEQGFFTLPRWERYAKNIRANKPVIPILRDRDRLISLGSAHAGKVVIIRTSTDDKRTAPFGRSLAVDATLRDRGYQTFVLQDHMPIDELAGLLLNAACVVGVDTGPTHFSAIMGVPTIVLGGHMPVDKIFGAYPSARFVQESSLSKIDPERVAAEVDRVVLSSIAAGRSIISLDRLVVIRDCVVATKDVKGIAVEAGAFRGGSAKIIGYFAGNRDVYVFDALGIPADDTAPGGHHKAGEFSSPEDELRSFLGSRFKLRIGVFPNTAADLPIATKISFAHLDLDTLESTRNALHYLVPRMAQGGIIVLDDYDWEHCPGIRMAIEEAGLIAEVLAPYQAVVRF